jgi:hypothetical protein
MLCDPLSPMPPTPQYIHADEEEDEEEIVVVQPAAKLSPAADKALPNGDRRRGQLNKVLENLKRTAENQAALNQGGNSTSSDVSLPSSSSTAPGTSGRRKMTDKPTKAELREEPVLVGESETDGPSSYVESSFSIFDAELDPLNLQGYSSREERQVVDSAGVETSPDVDSDLVQRVRKALEQQSLAAEDRPSSKQRIGSTNSVASSPRQTPGPVSRLSKCLTPSIAGEHIPAQDFSYCGAGVPVRLIR